MPQDNRNRIERAAYDAHVAGQELMAILNPAVSYLRAEAGT
jgi:hypothetical protein